MQTHSFKIILADVDDVVDDLTQKKFVEMSNALYEAGCDDGSPGMSAGVASIDFDREAGSLRRAIASAIGDVEKAGYRVARVEPSDQAVFDAVNSELTSRSTE
jgi:hypothetical protein